jgi:hypothetical protein
MMAAILADLRKEDQKQKITIWIAGGALVVSIINLIVSVIFSAI